MSSSPPHSEAAPFDALAPSYDADFTRSPIARALRDRIQQRLLALAPAGAAVLELGCGTGEDAHFLATHQRVVTATDVSPAMREIASARLAGFAGARVLPLDLNALGNTPLSGNYQLAFSNFGVFNCVHDLPLTARWLAGQVNAGGTVALCIMAPRCLWEMAWHGAHGNLGTAFRRWRTSIVFHTDTGDIAIRYPSVARVTRAFAPYFRRARVLPVGFFLPPSDMYPVLERRPRLLSRLMRLDNATRDWPALANFSDHYWIELTRTDTPA
ncbi:MAG: methyltransferase domain-containing protein [Pleurocapsa minor GSE-CHR-MK-17-07R]|nr:methyltransferase domain-containing protein [Pleurocapsa minor GSE-CHR-MK 17-07R]